MPNMTLQDVTAIINGTSRYGSGFDTCHVEMLLVTDTPFPAETSWYVPNQDGSTVPPDVNQILNLGQIKMYPQSEATLTQGIDDVKQQALNGDLQGVLDDMQKLILLALLKKVQLTPVLGTANTYMMKYDYKIFPNVQNSFNFYIQLPFDTLTLAAGGRIQCTAITPSGSVIDPVNTKGIDLNGTELQEQIGNAVASNRPVVSFVYQNDPIFTICYHY